MILGTAECVKKLKDTFLPGSVHKDIPQQLKIQKDGDFSNLIRKAAAMLDVDKQGPACIVPMEKRDTDKHKNRRAFRGELLFDQSYRYIGAIRIGDK